MNSGSTPTVSIVMSTFNGQKWLPSQLASLLAQTEAPLEVVIRDDGSTDETLQIVHEFAASAAFPVCVIPGEENIGFAQSFWSALRKARGDYALFCDQDDYWMPNKVELVRKRILKYQPNAIYHNYVARDLRSSSTMVHGRFKKQLLTFPLQFDILDMHLGCALGIRRSLFKYWLSVGLPAEFESKEPMAHDTFVARLANAAGKILCMPEILIEHHRHGANTAEYRPPLKGLQAIRSRVSLEELETRYARASEMFAYYSQVFESCTGDSECGSACARLATSCRRRSEILAARHRALHRKNPLLRFGAISKMAVGGSYGAANGGLGVRALAHDLIRLFQIGGVDLK